MNSQFELISVFFQIATGVVGLMTVFLAMFAFHSVWVTSEAYSSPSIVLSARGGDGNRIIFDDFREAYYWLKHNTPEVSEYQLELNLPCVLALSTTSFMISFNSMVLNYYFIHVLHLWLPVLCASSLGVNSDRNRPLFIFNVVLFHQSFLSSSKRKILYFQDAKVMSWWDYGYQITAMANRTILVDNNTWNNTHISRVGQVRNLS